jgi:hypothetical protein
MTTPRNVHEPASCLARDPLKTEFARKLHDDPTFAASTDSWLEFFFERSPWYAAQPLGAYPALRLDAWQLQSLSINPAAAGTTP